MSENRPHATFDTSDNETYNKIKKSMSVKGNAIKKIALQSVSNVIFALKLCKYATHKFKAFRLCSHMNATVMCMNTHRRPYDSIKQNALNDFGRNYFFPNNNFWILCWLSEWEPERDRERTPLFVFAYELEPFEHEQRHQQQSYKKT